MYFERVNFIIIDFPCWVHVDIACFKKYKKMKKIKITKKKKKRKEKEKLRTSLET
jgi:hypothetical protein